MIWLARVGIMAICAEWLIILRMWMAPYVLFLTIGITAARYYAIYYLPHVGTIAVIFMATLAATAWRLRALWRGTSGASRQVHETPDIGVPWIILLARTPRLIPFVELALVLLVVGWVGINGVVIFPRAMLQLPPEWRALFLAHGVLFATVFLWLQPVGIILWHVIHRPPREKPPEPPKPFTYQRVTAQEHSPIPLPSVKELTDELG